MRAALAHGLQPIVCIGESLAQRESGETEAVLMQQLKGGLARLSSQDMTAVSIAYEPVWAIGTGRTPTTAQVAEVHAEIRKDLLARFDDGAGFRILYGGSVKGSNAAEIFAVPDVDGALVGGASLKAVDFLPIVEAAAAG